MKRKKPIWQLFFLLILLIQTNSCRKEPEDSQLEIPSPVVFNPNLTYGTMTDQEGNVYKTIKIGTQTWMAENLRTTKFNDGAAIPEVNQFVGWPTIPFNRTSAYCWYNCDPSNKATYGALYNGFALSTGKLAPKGWHIPSDLEWATLLNYLDGYKLAAYKLKETGTSHWKIAEKKNSNESGFTAIPAGWRGRSYFTGIGKETEWWSSSPSKQPESNWCCRCFYYSSEGSYLANFSIDMGLSVRCIKDN